jgi:uncharacterized protein GlcG (DUF336 family)
MKLHKQFVLILSLILSTTGVQADLPAKKMLTLQTAKQIAAAAEAEAHKRGATVVIAVVDDGGHLLLLERLDDTQVASSEVAVGKARTAAIFRRPSKVFEDQIREGRVAALALPGATPLQGGLPLVFQDKVIGAIGVSGNTTQEDEEIAKAGVAGLSQAVEDPPVSPASYFPAERIQAGFAMSEFILKTPEYKVETARRVEPGIAEVHLGETDVFYVQEGSATFVTGGAIVDAKTTAPGEIRGPRIEGGESRHISKGDVLVEVWVDGELPRALGQSGGSVIKGWNAPNRLVIGRGVKPGQPIQLAVFGINGPLSDPWANFIWMRSAKLEFYRTNPSGPRAVEPQEVNVEIVRLDPALDAVVPPNPKIYKLAEGLTFTEGPLWVHAGYLLFSDPNDT